MPLSPFAHIMSSTLVVLQLYSEMYGELDSKQQLVEFLNKDSRVHSNVLYGDTQVIEGSVYGDGEVWPMLWC